MLEKDPIELKHCTEMADCNTVFFTLLGAIVIFAAYSELVLYDQLCPEA